MEQTELVRQLWKDMDEQSWGSLSSFFQTDAVIEWPNTGEIFTVDQFVRVNSEYPGKWKITVERLEQTRTAVISVVRVTLEGDRTAFTAVSFFEFKGKFISKLTEYWVDITAPPEWRKNFFNIF